MTDVFILYHLAEDASGDQDVKLIGVYKSEASATMAVNRLKSKPGFRNHPNIVDHTSDDGPGFNINKYLLDDDSNWTQGFDPNEA
jgi:hypothetical protein